MTKKARYDGDGSWKYEKYSGTEWDRLGERIRKKLRPFYPDKAATVDPTFGHPADGWANALLNEAHSAVSMMLWLRRRLTNEELRAEQADVLKTLKKADKCLSTLSHDLDIMLGVDADVLGCRDKIRDLIPRIDAAQTAIAGLPKARKLRDAKHSAAVEMAIRVLRLLKGEGVSIAATVNDNSGRVSDAVRVLKILGDELRLCLENATWRDVIVEVKRSVPNL